MKNYDHYINRQVEILSEFDDFADQFERRAAESFAKPKPDDKKFDLLQETVRESIDTRPDDRVSGGEG